jgi:hypothetical protein
LGGVLFGVATIRARVFSRQLGIGFIVLAVASFVLGFLSVPGGGGVPMSWWWGTTGTFGVVAYMIALAWYGIELFQNVVVATPTNRALWRAEDEENVGKGRPVSKRNSLPVLRR